jgi:hypothetical protein
MCRNTAKPKKWQEAVNYLEGLRKRRNLKQNSSPPKYEVG